MVGTGAVGSDLIDRTSIRRRGPVRRIAGVAGAILIMASVAAWVGLRDTRIVAAAPSDTVKILIGAAATLDPAAQGDIGSAAISAQLFEGLTAFDPQLKVRPALAESWDLLDGGPPDRLPPPAQPHVLATARRSPARTSSGAGSGSWTRRRPRRSCR